MAVTGTVTAVGSPSVTISPGTLSLGTTSAGTAGTSQTYTLSGSNLTSNLIVTPPTGVEVSDDGGTTWHATLSYEPVSGAVTSKTILARIEASATAGSITGNIVNASTGATSQDVAVTGAVTAAGSPSVSISPASLVLGTTTAGTAGTSQTYTVSGSNLTSNLVVTPPSGVEVSDDGGATWHATLSYEPVTGTVASKTILARIAASATAGSITGNITNNSIGATPQDVAVTGTVSAVGSPSVTITPATLSLGTTTAGTASATQTYAVSGSGLTSSLVVTAPTGVELSDDGGTTWHASLSYEPVAGVVASKTILARITSTASAGAITGSITNASTGATAEDVAVTGTVTAVGSPSVSISPASLALGTTTAGTAGATQTYTVSGSNLTSNLIVTPPSGVEVSDDGGTTWHASLSYEPVAGTVSSKTILARIAATATAGSITGSIANTSSAATTEDVAVTGTVTAVGAPSVTISPSALALGATTAGTAGTSQTYTLSGSNLTSNLVLTPPTGVELSDDGGATWHASLTYEPVAGTVSSKTILARIAATATAGSIAGSIANASTGATTQDVAVTGTVTAVGVPSVTISPSTLSLGTTTAGTAGTSQTYTVSGSNLTGNLVITPPSGVEVSDDGGTSWHSTLTYEPVAGVVSSKAILARIAATASAGSITGDITNAGTGATSQGVSVTGTVTAVGSPSVTITPATLSLGTTAAGSAGTSQTYTLSGSNLTSNLVVTPPTGVEVSDDSGTTWHSTLTLAQTSGVVPATTILARISAAAGVGAVTGSISNVSTGATTQDVAVTGTVTAVGAPSVSISPASLALGTATAGTAGTSQTYTVSGANLTSNLIVTPPSGVEVSDDGGTTWHATLTYEPVAGTVATKTILARISATATAGSITGSITNASTGATTENVTVTGTVTAVGAPSVTISPSTLSLGTTTAGTAGTSQTYTVSGSNLTSSLVVTPPTGVELSDDGGTTWHATLSYEPVTGTVASKTILARIAASATAGSITGSIANVSTGATTEDVAITGTVTAVGTPSVSISPSTLSLGSTTAGSAGTSQTYTLSGSNLTSSLAVTPPSGVEVSDDGGTSWHSTLTYEPVAGVVAAKTILARISATATAGSITGSITNASTGATTEDVSVTGTVTAVGAPSVSISPVTLPLGTTVAGTAGTSQTYTVSGSNLTGNLLVTAPTDVEVSDDGGTTWHASLSYVPVAGSVSSKSILARIAATASAGAIAGSISNASTGATTEDVTVTGTVTAVGAPSVSISPASLALGTATAGTAGTSQTYTVSGSDLTGSMVITPPSGVEVSDDGGATWHASLSYEPVAGTVSSKTIQSRIAATATAGSITGSITNASTGATSQDVAVTGTVTAVGAPSVTISPSTLSLGTTTAGTAGTSQTYTVSGSNLTSNLVITAPTGVEVSDDSGATWHTTLSLAQASGVVPATTILARIASTSGVGSVSGSITNASTGATAQDVSVTGTVTAVGAPSVSISPASLALGATPAGTAGSSQTYTVSGANLTASLLVTPPSGVEVSDDGGATWHASLSYVPVAGVVASKTILARISAAAGVGSIAGSITNTSTGATTEDVAVTGSVTAVVAPAVSITPSTLALGTAASGTPGTSQTYTVSGTNLTSNLTITAPTGVEVSDDSGATWHTTLSLAQASGVVPATTILARISAAASAGTIASTITNVSTGATTGDVAVTGTVTAVGSPSVSISPASLALGSTVAGTAGVTQTYTVSGSGLTSSLVVTVPTGVEVSDDGGTTWHTTLSYEPVAGVVASKTILARISATVGVGAITGSIANATTGATTEDVAVTGTVTGLGSPSVSISPGSMALGTTVAGTAGAPQSYTVSGSNLASSLIVTPPPGVEVSDDGGTTWHASLSYVPTAGTVSSKSILARISATAVVGSISGGITNFSAGAIVRDILVSGSVESPIAISPTNLPEAVAGSPYFEQLTASGGSGSGYAFSGAGLPPGLSISLDGILSGIPSAVAGSPFNFVITVSDGNGVARDFAYRLVVAKASANAGVIVASSPQTFYGQAVTLTATFSATAVGGSPLTGTVDFFDGSTYLGTATLAGPGALRAAIASVSVATVFGHANLMTSALSVGEHVITAAYSGDANYSPARAQVPVAVQVVPATTSTTLAATTSSQGTVLVATVVATSPGDPKVAGNVTFYDGAASLGTVRVTDGTASLALGALTPGPHDFTAVFSGDGTASNSSASASVTSTGGPQVVGLSRLGFHDRSTVLVLNFNAPLDAARAQDVANYRITDAKGRRIAILSARYDASTMTVTLVPSQRLNVHLAYMLTVVGTGPNGLTDTSGVPLDGSGTGTPGTDFRTTLTWTALAAPGSPPAITFVHGQAHGYSGSFNRYASAVVRMTQAAAHSLKLARIGRPPSDHVAHPKPANSHQIARTPRCGR